MSIYVNAINNFSSYVKKTVPGEFTLRSSFISGGRMVAWTLSNGEDSHLLTCMPTNKFNAMIDSHDEVNEVIADLKRRLEEIIDFI